MRVSDTGFIVGMGRIVFVFEEVEHPKLFGVDEMVLFEKK